MNSSEKIDRQIAELDDLRGEQLRQIRELINSVDPGLEEDFKWNTGVWVYDGKLVCAFNAFKEHVKINFFKGALLADPHNFFNNGLGSKEHRSIDIKEGESINKAAVCKLVADAIQLVQ